MKLTMPQIRYLGRAIEINAIQGRGVFFCGWALGGQNTARALQRKGLIESYLPTHVWPYVVTEEGVHVYLNQPIELREKAEQSK